MGVGQTPLPPPAAVSDRDDSTVVLFKSVFQLFDELWREMVRWLIEQKQVSRRGESDSEFIPPAHPDG